MTKYLNSARRRGGILVHRKLFAGNCLFFGGAEIGTASRAALPSVDLRVTVWYAPFQESSQPTREGIEMVELRVHAVEQSGYQLFSILGQSSANVLDCIVIV